jgi:tetratricopeptide (TPR) repeat protein
VLETASRFFGYITEHTRGLLLAVLAVLALVLVAVGVFAYLDGRQERANEAFAEALAVFDADVVGVGASPEDPLSPSFASEESRDLKARELFEEVQTTYGSTSVGRIAGVYLGKLALRSGDTARARELWESFVESDADDMLMMEVRLNLLAMDRAEGRGEEVVSQLREEIGSSTPTLPIAVSLDQLATTLEELGRIDEAREVYQRIIDEHPGSPYLSRAQQRLSTL